jgi:hypothetical protein
LENIQRQLSVLSKLGKCLSREGVSVGIASGKDAINLLHISFV